MRHTVKKVGSTGLGLEAATGKKSGMTFEKFEGMGMQKLTPQEIAGGKGIPSIEGIFGPAYDGYEGKPIAAASKLLKEKTGEVKNAFTDPDGENIDYTYGKLGEEGYGIGHIAEKHGKKILVRIPEVVLNGKKIRTSDNRVI
ncbi:hypothetical protein SDC9_174374 [bioreactor metagenome]|uniref:Uncharacterized protein n=2 Tax=root TaxID=1 RepID=A0A645GJ38_9ZZZZ